MHLLCEVLKLCSIIKTMQIVLHKLEVVQGSQIEQILRVCILEIPNNHSMKWGQM